jgi:single-stranded DNA-binding protein
MNDLNNKTEKEVVDTIKNNEVQLVGNLGGDAKVFEATGYTILKFSIAVSLPKDKVLWQECKLIVKNDVQERHIYLAKLKRGSRVEIIGSLDDESFKTKEGKLVSKILIKINKINFVAFTKKAKDMVKDQNERINNTIENQKDDEVFDNDLGFDIPF